MGKSFAHELISLAEAAPDHPALLFPNGLVTRGQLAQMVLRYAAGLQAQGVAQETRLLVHCMRNRPEALLVQLAAALLGASWTTLRPTLSIRSIGASHLVHIDGPVTELPGHRTIRIDAMFAAGAGADTSRVDQFPGYATNESLVALAGSSGTTGTPKLIPISVHHFSLGGATVKATGTVANTQFPVTSMIGFGTMVRTLKRGGIVAIADRFGDLMSLGVDEISASPAQLERLLGDAPPPGERVGSLRCVGSLVSNAALQRWLGYFKAITIGYGSTEGGGGGSATITTVPDDFVLRYQMRDGVEFEVVDEAGQVLPLGTQGTLRLRTNYTISGYIDAPEATAEAFRDGWFYPGDLAVAGAGREITIVGRVRDQFNFGGVKVNAADIDAAAAQVPGIVTVVSFLMDTDGGAAVPAIMVTLRGGADPKAIATSIRQRCRTILRQAAERLVVYVADALPLTDTGKPVRREARELARSLTPV